MRLPAQELVGAIERLDGEPGTRPVVQDLSQILATFDPAALASVRSDIVTLATLGKNEITRQGAFAALLRADAGSNRRLRAWDIASASQRSRMDLLLGAARLNDGDAAGGALAEDPGVARRQAGGIPRRRCRDASFGSSPRVRSGACDSPKSTS